MRTPEQIVQAEVLCCLSSLVSTLAGGYGDNIVHVNSHGRRSTNGDDLPDLTEQAFELTAPIEDWEEAALSAGWTQRKDGMFIHPDHLLEGTDATEDGGTDFDLEPFGYSDWRELCNEQDIEPYDREVFEHWDVTDWFADQLIKHGEKVDKDFAGLCVWARTTTGQAIAADYVLERIAADLTRRA